MESHSELPYAPVQFWKLLSRYHTIAKSRFEEVCAILDKYSEDPIHLVLDAKSNEVTVASLVQEIKENLRLGAVFAGQIEKEVLPSLGVQVTLDLSSLVPTLPSPGVDATPDTSSDVANISLRECRLWSVLNTTGFHQKLQQANGDKDKLAPVMAEVAAVISASHIMGIPPLVVKLKRSKGGNMVTPYMLFICLGQNKDGEKLHNLVHIGCTREWMVQWDSLYKLRDSARDDRIGAASIKAWKEWHYQLSAMDTAAGNGIENEDDKKKAILEARTALLLGDSDAVPEPGKKLLGVKLRDCSSHLGQSFRQLEWAQVEAFPCCMFCKTTQAWNEVMDPKILESVSIKLGQRKDCPHSCAEVATSGYCDFITHGGEN